MPGAVDIRQALALGWASDDHNESLDWLQSQLLWRLVLFMCEIDLH